MRVLGSRSGWGAKPDRWPPAAQVQLSIRPLIPLAEKFGISDDLIRQDFVTQTPEAELVEWRRVVQENDHLLDEWLAHPEADTLAKEYLAFTTMRMAADGV